MKRRHMLLTILSFVPFKLFSITNLTPESRANKGFVITNGDARFGEHYKMKGITLNKLDVKISSQDTAGDLAVFEQIGLTAKGGPPLHIHPFQDEWFYVVDGNYLFQVGIEKYNLKQGDTIFLPRGIQHAFAQISKTGKMIVSYLPAGKMEAFFKVTSEWTSPPSKEDIKKIFEDHDMKIVGPPLSIG